MHVFCSSEEIRGRLQYSEAILIHFMSNVWLWAHFPPNNFVIWWKNSIFDKKNWFHAIPWLHLQKMSKNITLQLGQNSGETDLVTLIHQNMSKIGCFWAFSHFFCFWGPFFWELWTQNLLLFIKCGMKYPKWPIYTTTLHKKELSNLTKNEIVLPPKHGNPP